MVTAKLSLQMNMERYQTHFLEVIDSQVSDSVDIFLILQFTVLLKAENFLSRFWRKKKKPVVAKRMNFISQMNET